MIELPSYIQVLMQEAEQAGKEIYLVGGSLRDALLGKEPHDYDLATSALPSEALEIYKSYRVIETGLQHGTVTVLYQGHPVEITTFRIDGAYTDSRHPDGVTFTSKLVDDLSRRDFTVNAMAYHPRVGLVDPFGGQEDLRRGLLRAVGDPQRRFREDALRIMRAFRFSAQLGFAIEEGTVQGIEQTKEGLSRISVERIAAELLRLLCSDAPENPLRQMVELGILPYVCGEYRPSERIIEQLSRMQADEVGRLGWFFSDTDEATAAMLLRRLKCSNKQITGCRAVIRGSRRAILTPADGRSLIADTGVYASMGVRASVLRGLSPEEATDWVEHNQSPCTIADLAVGGRELMAAGIEPRHLGSVLSELLRLVLEEPSNNEPERLISLALAYDKKKTQGMKQ